MKFFCREPLPNKIRYQHWPHLMYQLKSSLHPNSYPLTIKKWILLLLLSALFDFSTLKTIHNLLISNPWQNATLLAGCTRYNTTGHQSIAFIYHCFILLGFYYRFIIIIFSLSHLKMAFGLQFWWVGVEDFKSKQLHYLSVLYI